MAHFWRITPGQLKKLPKSEYMAMRKTYLDHIAYEDEAIERAKNGEDEEDPLRDAPWDAETVIVPL